MTRKKKNLTMLLFLTIGIFNYNLFGDLLDFEKDVKNMGKKVVDLRSMQLTNNTKIKVIIKDLKNQLKKFENSEVNLNNMNGLGEIEQLKVRAERYGFERELRIEIADDINSIDKILSDMDKNNEKILMLNEQITSKQSIVNLLKSKVNKDTEAENVLLEEDIRYYTVQENDTLENISDLPEVYGDSERWIDLYNVNQKVIGKKGREVIIKKGVELIVPSDSISKNFKKY